MPGSAKTRSKTLDEWVTDLQWRYSAPSPRWLGWWQFRAFTNAVDSEVLAGSGSITCPPMTGGWCG